ncbi:hypothetical protein TraAM80_05961 [Trypanosoma rangeli]|uniref:CBF1-interacting co-repressor CIR N-terminal domain-containing protein n=1 Tax=Trypanosoma rangeli TaxID=5698 RepID=A0A422NC58_TRYRA|nr:uncharacterized protein TraAM80_05961 [Trypanosoma rangeli]RNF03084.1 hypothetical protein TraAM80_05961 [Trypanosoma rangeli]|eukprot:RNF03084.1 hypothetical protein TraAM80_05961 [Trypanosoma rangeli]
MYAAHKKDINRHKSFHPLTYRNLSKVEQRQQEDEAKKKSAAERREELRRDQEQRRYDDLILAASADGVSGQLAKFRQVENIFAAEAKTERAGRSTSSGSGDLAGLSSLPLLKSGTLVFRKDEARQDNDEARSVRKRGRDEGCLPVDNNGSEVEGPGKDRKAVTGFMSTSDAAQLRKELDKLQKERHDPLRRIEQFQNRTVAAEAKRRALAAKTAAATVSTGTREDTEKDVIHSRIQELLLMKRRK